MSIFDNLRNGVRDWLGLNDQSAVSRYSEIEHNRAYASGEQKKMLYVTPGKTDDNVTVNVIGLIVDRWVSWLFGREIEFDLPGEEDSQEQIYIDGVWDANKKSILLHKLGENGTVAGTTYLKILDGEQPRLIAIDPKFVQIDTDPEDVESVIRYTISYTVGDYEIKEVSELDNGKWTVTKVTKKGAWKTVEDLEWKYDFPPIAHCQNLPAIDSPYGIPDITASARKLQDSINLVASNINKANRLHSAPQLWGHNLNTFKEIDSGPNKIIDVGSTGDLNSLQMSEMVGSSNFLQWLVKQLYVTTRTIDLDSLADKLGALTNFGLRVLYEDTMTKLETKRSLYGDMLKEVNRRLLVIGGFSNTDPGDIHWEDVIPSNETEKVASLQALKNLGVVSNETIAMQMGLDYAAEQDKIAKDKTSEGNIGAALLSAFNRSGNQIQ